MRYERENKQVEITLKALAVLKKSGGKDMKAAKLLNKELNKLINLVVYFADDELKEKVIKDYENSFTRMNSRELERNFRDFRDILSSLMNNPNMDSIYSVIGAWSAFRKIIGFTKTPPKESILDIW